eukprot:2622848-Lingulodinium_polyedra.AAC.1
MAPQQHEQGRGLAAPLREGERDAKVVTHEQVLAHPRARVSQLLPHCMHAPSDLLRAHALVPAQP